MFSLLIDEFQPADLIELRPDFSECGCWPYLGLKPWIIRAGHREFGKHLIAPVKLPHALGFAHGSMLPSALPAQMSASEVAGSGHG
jgi:hypothetical protein